MIVNMKWDDRHEHPPSSEEEEEEIESLKFRIQLKKSQGLHEIGV